MNVDFNIDDLGFDFDTDELANFEMDLTQFEETRNRYQKPIIYAPIPQKNLKYQYAEEIAQQFHFEENERINCIVGGKFIFCDLIEALIITNGIKLKNLTIATLSLNKDVIDSFANIQECEATDKFNLIISHYEYSHSNLLIKYLFEMLDVRNTFQLAVYRNHAKFALMETEDGMKVVLHGSANLRSCASIEQVVIEENKQFYDFLNEDTNLLIEKYGIINKNIKK